MTDCSADNLETDTTQDGRVVIEPSYLGYLRSEGYIIEGIESLHTVHSDSREMAHVVLEVETYEYPRNHQELDYATHGMTIAVCDCWAFRQNSKDVTEPETKPGGDCKHIRQCFREEKAQADDKQATLE